MCHPYRCRRTILGGLAFALAAFGDAPGECVEATEPSSDTSLLQVRKRLINGVAPGLRSFACNLGHREMIWDALPDGRFQNRNYYGLVVDELPDHCRPLELDPPRLELIPMNGSTTNKSSDTRSSSAEKPLPLIPYPVDLHLDKTQGPFQFSSHVSVSVGPGIAEDAPALVALRQHLKRVAKAEAVSNNSTGRIFLSLALPETDPEGYHMKIGPGSVEITAPALTGLFYGVQTLMQLTPQGPGACLPSLVIRDAPRFRWRGIHLDVSRHFFSAGEVKKLLDTMAGFKLNHFHWHLTDDQGWRLPIEGYPRLVSVGGNSSGTQQAYTAKEITDVIAYAAARHIEVLPEVDVPGHVGAAIAAYPELGNTDIPNWQPPLHPELTYGVHHWTMAPSNSTLSFLEKVFDEVVKLFPAANVHIGGDEVPKDQWQLSERATALLNHSSFHGVQAFFNQQLAEMLGKRNKTVVAWDEVLDVGGATNDTIVMAWRSQQTLRNVLRSGRRAINADQDKLYFDHYQSRNPKEPPAFCCYTSLRQVYEYDPMPWGLTKEQQALLMGAQAQLWSEHFPNFAHVEYMAFPRSFAAAERFWTPTEVINKRGFSDFTERLQVRLTGLEQMGVKYRPLD